MAEWLKARASKACIPLRVSGVRIPLSPPSPDYRASRARLLSRLRPLSSRALLTHWRRDAGLDHFLHCASTNSSTSSSRNFHSPFPLVGPSLMERSRGSRRPSAWFRNHPLLTPRHSPTSLPPIER